LMLLFFVPHSQVSPTESVLHTFNFTDGYDPESGVTLDSKGNLYGATLYGGTGSACTSGCGLIFKLERDASGVWTETTIYTFSGGDDGNHPLSPLTFDAMGNLYGTPYGDNDDGGRGLGTVFKLSPAADGTWSLQTLWTFVGGTYGSRPEGSWFLTMGEGFTVGLLREDGTTPELSSS
jgi:hypothetical protein